MTHLHRAGRNCGPLTAVLSAIRTNLPEHIVGQSSEPVNTINNVAAPVRQSTNKTLTGASMDQTVQKKRRTLSETVDLTDGEDQYVMNISRQVKPRGTRRPKTPNIAGSRQPITP